LDYLNAAYVLDDLRVSPANRLEALERELKGKYSIRINKRYRIVFAFENGNAYDVVITDYH
jgi:proteic killer suppression protein